MTPGRRHFAFLAAAPSATGIAHTLPVADPITRYSVRYATHDADVVGAGVAQQPERASRFPGAPA